MNFFFPPFLSVPPTIQPVIVTIIIQPGESVARSCYILVAATGRVSGEPVYSEMGRWRGGQQKGLRDVYSNDRVRYFYLFFYFSFTRPETRSSSRRLRHTIPDVTKALWPLVVEGSAPNSFHVRAAPRTPDRRAQAQRCVHDFTVASSYNNYCNRIRVLLLLVYFHSSNIDLDPRGNVQV